MESLPVRHLLYQLDALKGYRYQMSFFYPHRRNTAWEVEKLIFILGEELGDDVGRDPKDTKKQAKRQWAAFKDYKLSEAQKDAFENWDIHDNDLYLLVATECQSGYKFSTTYNAGNDTFTASLTGPGVRDVNADYTLSAFAPDWYSAVRVLMFKHVVCLECDWTNCGGTSGERWG